MFNINTAENAIEFAIEELTDDYDRLEFLKAWRDGSVMFNKDWTDYQQWLYQRETSMQQDILEINEEGNAPPWLWPLSTLIIGLFFATLALALFGK